MSEPAAKPLPAALHPFTCAVGLSTFSLTRTLSTSSLPAECNDELKRLNQIITTATELDLVRRFESAKWVMSELDH